MKKTYANYLSTKLILKTAQQYVYTQTIGWPISGIVECQNDKSYIKVLGKLLDACMHPTGWRFALTARGTCRERAVDNFFFYPVA